MEDTKNQNINPNLTFSIKSSKHHVINNVFPNRLQLSIKPLSSKSLQIIRPNTEQNLHQSRFDQINSAYKTSTNPVIKINP